MAAFHFPTLGTRLTLTADWTFPLYIEHRNKSVHQALVGEFPFHYYRMKDVSNLVTLPAGTVLVLDRIYVRKGAGDFDSLTFSVAACPDPRLVPKSKKGFLSGQARFWAKLADINGKLHCDIAEVRHGE